MNKIKVLVTGACGVTSRSVVRSLNMSPLFSKTFSFIGTDVCYNPYGLYEGLYDKVYKVPYTSSPDYRNIIENIIYENEIRYAIVIPELEVLYWCENPFSVPFYRIPLNFAKLVISKKRLYEALSKTDLIPKWQICDRNDLLSNKMVSLKYPFWIRDYEEGTTSGRGACKVNDIEELRAWVTINKGINSYMLSEYLPGRNLCCFTLYKDGILLKYGVAQRIQYIMSKVAVSGITGNINVGKLLNDELTVNRVVKSINKLTKITGEKMNGLVVTDLKCDENDIPKVTEINIRHIATTSSFACAGLNFAEMQMLCLMGRETELSSEKTILFPTDNAILRDVDGRPLYVSHYKELNIGEYFPLLD
ncbi:MAG: hypothetical protein J5588_08285 [Bacteroidales bacterium]|nr:hypothetical protein [Bacteroidales bacterium]